MKTAMWKRIVLLLVVLLFAAGCAYFADRATYQKFRSYDAVVPVNTVFQDDTDILYLNDCEVKNGVLTVTGADPHFAVDAFGEEAYRVRIKFHRSLPQNTFLQLYMAPAGEDFSEGNSVSWTIPAGEKDAVYLIPLRKYSAFRFDFGQDVSIDRIYTEKDQHFVLEDKPDIIRLATVFGLIFIPLCVLILVYKREQQ